MRGIAVLTFLSWSLLAAGHAPAQELGDPPRRAEAAALPKAPRTSIEQGFSVDISDRQDVVDFFQNVYVPGVGLDANWTGDVGSCDPGDIPASYRQAMLDRINYYRAMAQLPANVGLNDDYNQMCQEAALVFVAEQNLSHTISSDWACYTEEAATAASSSNIALGEGFPPGNSAAGPEAIDFYMQDPGGPNYFVGHRRWFLFPPQETMGIGAAGSKGDWRSSAVWVAGPFGARPATPQWVSWPPPGFVPMQTVFPRWSFSHPGADFGGASISMTKNGSPISLSINPGESGFGDPTIVWEPDGLEDPSGSEEVTYHVTIENVMIEGSPQTFEYDVRVIDPSAPVPTPDPETVVAEVLTGMREAPSGSDFDAADANDDGILDAADMVALVWQGR